MSEIEIQKTLEQVLSGDHAARIDEAKLNPELRSVAGLMNTVFARFQKVQGEASSAGEEAAILKKRFDRIIRDNPLAITILGPDKTRLDANEEYIRMWRGTREEVMRKKLSDYDITILKGEDPNSCYQTKKRSVTRILAKWPDGVRKYLTVTAVPLLDEAGEIDMAFYMWDDWTDMHDQIEEGKALQRQAESIVQENPLAITVLDRNRKRIDLNEEYTRMWRGTREELLKKTLADYNIRVLSGDDFYATFDLRRRMHSEMEVTFPDGVKKLLELDGIPILDKKGEVEMAFYVYDDITAQRQKEEEIERLSKETGDILNALGTVPVMKIDRNFNVRMINAAGASLIGRKPEEVVGMKCYDVFQTEHCRTPECRCTQAMQSRRSESGETVARPRGREIPILYDATPLFDDAGNVVEAVEYVTDLTEIKKKSGRSRN